MRIYVLQENFLGANGICEETGDPQACYQLAKQFEKRGQLVEAVQLYGKANQISQAMKLAIENEMDNEIMSLSVSGPKQVMAKAGAYFEQKGYNEKAIILVHEEQQLETCP